MTTNTPHEGKKRRRKSSGRCRAEMKQRVRESTDRLLAQVTDSSDEDEQTKTEHNPTAEFQRIHKPHKPSANVTSTKGRQYTVSVALPGSIVNNAQTWELKTALVGQVNFQSIPSACRFTRHHFDTWRKYRLHELVPFSVSMR